MCVYSETLSLFRVFFYIKFNQKPKTKDQSEKDTEVKRILLIQSRMWLKTKLRLRVNLAKTT
jgi:hypothetical protein